MGLIQKVKERASEVLSYVQTVLDDLYDRIATKIRVWYSRYKSYLEKMVYQSQKEEFINQTIESQYTCTETPADTQLKYECQSYLDETLPEGLNEALRPLSNQERERFLTKLVNDLSQIMGVDINDVSFFVPSSMKECGTFGIYNHEEKRVTLNALFIIKLDEPKLIEHMVKTVLHELRHAMQFAAVTGENSFYFDPKTIDTWRYNIAYYISPEECDEAYRKQPVEVDAIWWASLFKLNAESY